MSSWIARVLRTQVALPAFIDESCAPGRSDPEERDDLDVHRSKLRIAAIASGASMSGKVVMQ